MCASEFNKGDAIELQQSHKDKYLKVFSDLLAKVSGESEIQGKAAFISFKTLFYSLSQKNSLWT